MITEYINEIFTKEEFDRYTEDGLTEEQISLFASSLLNIKTLIFEAKEEYDIDLYYLFDLLRYIYVAKHIRFEGVTYEDCQNYVTREAYIDALFHIGLIKESDWKCYHGRLFITTPAGNEAGGILIEQYMKQINFSELEKRYGKFLLYYLYDNKIYRSDLNFSKRSIISYYEFVNQKGEISPLFEWCAEYFDKQLDLFEYLENKKIAVRARNYVSTRGKRIDDYCILLSQKEFHKFLKDNESQIQNEQYRKKLRKLSNELVPKWSALILIDGYHYESYTYKRFGPQVKNEIILLISRLKDEGVIELEEKYIQYKSLLRPPYRIIDDAYSGVIKGLMEEFKEYANRKIEELLGLSVLLPEGTEEKAPVSPPLTLSSLPELPAKPEIELKLTATSYLPEITFPTTPDEDKASCILGRGDLYKNLMLGMNENGKYISLPWNGNESHIAMFCGTGTGKSTLASSIVLQSVFQRIPVVTFDPKDGWGISIIKPIQDIMNSLSPEKHKVIRERFELTKQSMYGFDLSQPQRFKINGEEYCIEYKIFTFDENVRKKVNNVKEYKIPLINIPNVFRSLEETEQKYLNRVEATCNMIATSFVEALPLRKKGIPYNAEISMILQKYKDTDKEFFTQDEFIELLRNHESEFIEKSGMKELMDAIITYYTANSKFIAKNVDEVTPITEIFNNPFIEENNKVTISVFDIQSIGAMVEKDKSKIMTMYVSSITGQICDYINKKNPPKGKGYEIGMPKVWLIYDEAHNLIEEGKTTSNNNIKRVLQEGRSLGAYAVIISQKPQNVDITARQQAKNRIYAEVTWDSIQKDHNVPEETKSKIKNNVNNSTKTTKKMTFVSENFPEGELIYPLTSPQCVLAKADVLSLI